MDRPRQLGPERQLGIGRLPLVAVGPPYRRGELAEHMLHSPSTRHILTCSRMRRRVSEMAVWYAARTMSWSTRLTIVAALLAALLVATVPVALCVGVVLMLLGHVVGGLALFGASILAAATAVVTASLGGARQLRKLVSRASYPVVPLGRGEYHYN